METQQDGKIKGYPIITAATAVGFSETQHV
jgi:hypothetical protein